VAVLAGLGGRACKHIGGKGEVIACLMAAIVMMMMTMMMMVTVMVGMMEMMM